MLFGKSLFQSVIDRLNEEAEEIAPVEEPVFRINGLATSFVPTTTQTSAGSADPSIDQRLDAYRSIMPADVEPDAPEPPTPPAPPVWLERLSLEDIAEDLGMEPADDRDRLQERRRTFARENHPDRVADEYRLAATQRMKIANRLIDEAIRRWDLAIGR